MKLTAAVFRENVDCASFESLDVTDVRDDEVVVRITASGVCHTDVASKEGRYPAPRPIVLGHEGSGIVERIGARVSKVGVGDHVVLSFAYCGHCASCASGFPFACHHFNDVNLGGTRPDGTCATRADGGPIGTHFFGQSSFATHSVVNQRSVVKVRKDAPLDLLGPLGCGVQTGAGAVMNVLRPKRNDSVVIFGGGGVGLSAVMAAKVLGSSPIIVIEPNPSRRLVAMDLGATHCIDPIDADVVSDILSQTNGNGALHAIDTTGLPDVLSNMFRAIAPRGQICLLTLHEMDQSLQVPILDMIAKGLSVFGVCEGRSIPDQFIPFLVDLIVKGVFPLEKIVKFYDFSELDIALKDQQAGASIKPILRMPAVANR